MISCGQVPSLSYSQATLRISFSAKLCASSRRSFCSSVSVKSTASGAPLRALEESRLTDQSITTAEGYLIYPEGVPSLTASLLPRGLQRRGDPDRRPGRDPDRRDRLRRQRRRTPSSRSARAGSRSSSSPTLPQGMRDSGAEGEPAGAARGRAAPDARGEGLPPERPRRDAARRRRRARAAARRAARRPGRPGADPALREEVRQLVVARNERRARQGKEPLDVDAEVERQLRELENLGQ